ncbi:MAG: MazG-like family protein [Patescibacteria group bacterium]
MKNLEKDIYEYLKERNWDQVRASDLAKSVMIEGAELLEIFQWDEATLEDVMQDEVMLEKVKEELADVLIYAIQMAVLLKLDTEDIVRTKLDYVSQKYPAELMKQETRGDVKESHYLRIKQEHRARRNAKE